MREKKRVKLNINATVGVKLTEYGNSVYREYYSISEDPIPDTEGCIRMPLWLAMKIFGPHLTMGFVTPIETEIEILGEK